MSPGIASPFYFFLFPFSYGRSPYRKFFTEGRCRAGPASLALPRNRRPLLFNAEIVLPTSGIAARKWNCTPDGARDHTGSGLSKRQMACLVPHPGDTENPGCCSYCRLPVRTADRRSLSLLLKAPPRFASTMPREWAPVPFDSTAPGAALLVHRETSRTASSDNDRQESESCPAAPDKPFDAPGQCAATNSQPTRAAAGSGLPMPANGSRCMSRTRRMIRIA